MNVTVSDHIKAALEMLDDVLSGEYCGHAGFFLAELKRRNEDPSASDVEAALQITLDRFAGRTH
jgi:hypothetical protein